MIATHNITSIATKQRRESGSTSSTTLSESAVGDEKGSEFDDLIQRITEEVAFQITKKGEEDDDSFKNKTDSKRTEMNMETVAQLILQSVEITKAGADGDLLRSSMHKSTISTMDSSNHDASTVSSRKSCSSDSSDIWGDDFWSDELDLLGDVPPSEEFSVGSSKAEIMTRRSQSKAPTNNGSNVRFGHITVREYQQVLAVNPGCRGGPSLSIGWEYLEHPSLPVNAFEKVRRSKRRAGNSSDLVLSRRKREVILERLGYSESEIAENVRQGNKVRNQRRQTNTNLGTDSMGFVIQKAARKLQGMWSLNKKKDRA